MKKTTSRTRARRKPVRKATKTGHRVMRAHTGRRSELFGLALLAAGLISICGICGLNVGFVGVYFAKFLRYIMKHFQELWGEKKGPMLLLAQ